MDGISDEELETCFRPVMFYRKQILIELNFEAETLCNIYQIGSRVYGTFRDDSDYDFFMVISDEFYERLNENYLEKSFTFHEKFKNSWVVYSDDSSAVLENQIETEWSREEKSGMGREFQCLSLQSMCGAELNVNLYNYSSFKKRLESNWIQSIMCYSMSEQFVPSLDFPELHDCFKLYFRKIALSAIAEASSHYRLAKKYWNSTNTYRSKKYIVHTFRDLQFAIQIVKYRRIVDFSQTNDLYYEVMSKKETDWSQFDAIYYARYQNLKEELNELVKLPPILKEIIHNNPINIIQNYSSRMNNDFKCISEELESYFSLHIIHKIENNIEYLFIRGTDETPLYSKFTLQVFNGCLLAKSDKKAELICLSHVKVFPLGNRYQSKLEIKKGCEIWKIEYSNENTYCTMMHIYYDSFTKSWSILPNDTIPSSEKIWNKFKELGFPVPENESFTYTFELLLQRETMDIKQVNLFSIQNVAREVMMDFSNMGYSTKRIKHSDLTSLVHVTNYAKQFSPLETKEILIFDETSIISCISQDIPSYRTGYFTQQLDHFDFTNDATFLQRYFVCDLFVKQRASIKQDKYFHNLIQVDPLVPIIAYPGNEGALEEFYENTGLVFELAKHYGALVLFIEHRYYGKTVPSQDPQKYLTIEQATHDLAVFFTENFGLDELRKNPIILVGGSYGGDLAAWMRFKFPHLIDGSIAASAPILFFNEITPPYLAAQIATEAYRNLTNFQVYPKITCDNAVKKGFEYLSKYFENASKDQLQMLSRKFKLCNELQTNIEVKVLASYIAFSFEVLAQANYPYPANFFSSLPAWPVNGLCTSIAKRLATSPNLENEDLYFSILFDGVNLFQNYSGSISCFNTSNLGGGLQWSYWSLQLCNEMILPAGFYTNSDMFFSNPYSLKDQLKACVSKYKFNPQPYWLATYFGGKRSLTEHSNIIFSNGQYDAVRAGGVEKGMKTSPTIIPIYIEQGGHHLDIRWSNINDPPSVKIAREIEFKQVGVWIQQFLRSLN